MHLATCRPSGMPHLVSRWYSQVEEGKHASEVRGVEIEGVARFLDDPADVATVGRAAIRAGFGEEPGDETFELMGVRNRAAVVEPVRIASWDHRKIPGGYLAGALPRTVR